MIPQYDDFLCRKYPKIFVNRHQDMQNTCMCWGFECEDGWRFILDTLCSKIQKYLDDNSLPQVVASQVKEKYGTLRFYTEAHDDFVDKLIEDAEDLSARTCELCGKDGELTGNSWYKTRCNECLKK